MAFNILYRVTWSIYVWLQAISTRTTIRQEHTPIVGMRTEQRGHSVITMQIYFNFREPTFRLDRNVSGYDYHVKGKYLKYTKAQFLGIIFGYLLRSKT